MLRRHLALRGAFVGLAAALVGVIAAAVAEGGDATVWAFAIAAAVVAGGLLGWLALEAPARAVHDVADASGRLAEGQLDQRVEVVGGPANELTHGFNVMAGRVQE